MSKKLFKMTADVPMGKVVFGLFNNRPWVAVENQSGDMVSSIDHPVKAVRLATNFLDTELWPEFAKRLLFVLKDSNEETLF